MSFLRHRQIYQSDVFLVSGWRRSCFRLRPRSHRLDEFAASYSLAGCTPAEPASALPAGSIFNQPAETVNHLLRKVGDFSIGRMRNFQPVLTIRDEGTSYHYLGPAHEVSCPPLLTEPIARELSCIGLTVRVGKVWTTDAPYRETSTQLENWAREGALAVEMQAASLFAFAQARKAQVAVVARVSNAVDHEGGQFDTGSHDQGLTILRALARAGRSILGCSTPDPVRIPGTPACPGARE
jgi:nucleoside phosphorylase